ncbi:hypothetical protein [Actinocatenispora sera]|uniref:Uncharacterized protein n=1 Tax=Actinocatenispora sera TaxID=390989 RepID=A0A810KXK8_9ACTN|nr:hypothetical protein [Actinocatenispora sera]BCJ27066.1 hypothetical protein Asera_11740 [Actinocatenispora sera]
MNDEKLRELFIDADPVDEPPLAPGYLASTTAAADRAARRRRLRRFTVGGVAAVAALAITGLVVQPQLPGTTTARVSAASAGGGSYDPLISRLAPGWLPSGANLHERSVENRVQSLRVEKWEGDAKRIQKTDWAIELFLYPPGVKQASDGPHEHQRFGHGTKTAPVQGMPAELLGDGPAYELAWRYPSGAHAIVQIDATGTFVKAGDSPKGYHTGFGDQTTAVARRIAANLRIDGHTPLTFPFALHLPAGQHVVAASSRTMRGNDGKLTTDALLTWGTSAGMKTWSTVDVSSPARKGKPEMFTSGVYFIPNTHGFTLQASARHGDSKKLAEQVQIFGSPTDVSTWRADPVLD